MKIKVKYHSENSKPIKPAHNGEWIDLKTAQDENIVPGQSRMINLGVSIAIPEGYEAIMAMRSSTFKNYGLIQTNGIGVIDNAYSGDDDIWHLPVYAFKAVTIPAGTRIAQFRIQPINPDIDIEEVEGSMGESRGGFGSTGV